MTGSQRATDRSVLVVHHHGRAAARQLVVTLCDALASHGFAVFAPSDDAIAAELPSYVTRLDVDAEGSVGAGCELALVVGGDGTILRSAELTRGTGTALLGINLGHVGFLAETEPDQLDQVIAAVVSGSYTCEDRLTLDVTVLKGDQVVARTFALNDASVEKADRERMLDVVVEIDGRPLSRWGCDGIVCATPTGSTAYNFSAGGPIVWPGVEALLMVPISAHALFARPLVVSPASTLAIEVLAGTEGAGVLWCDGRRTVDLPPGARIEVRRGAAPVRLVRLTEEAFADRLVAKFDLPVDGWRGKAERRRAEASGGDGG